jgi:hypothetical protein
MSLHVSQTEIQGLHPAQASLGYFLAWFLSAASLYSVQKFSSSIPMRFLKYVLNCEQNFSFFIFRSGLTVTGLAMIYYVYISNVTSSPRQRQRLQ